MCIIFAWWLNLLSFYIDFGMIDKILSCDWLNQWLFYSLALIRVLLKFSKGYRWVSWLPLSRQLRLYQHWARLLLCLPSGIHAKRRLVSRWYSYLWRAGWVFFGDSFVQHDNRNVRKYIWFTSLPLLTWLHQGWQWKLCCKFFN